MKTTTLITNGHKMVDATYKVTLELGYSETTLFVTALEAQLATYRKLVADNPNAMAQSPEAFKAIESIIENLKTGVKAFNVQSLIEGGNLSIGTAFVQD